MTTNQLLDTSGFITVTKGLGQENNSITLTKNEKKHAELKLWICDLLTIGKENCVNNFQFFDFRGLSVNIVNIYGVVTEVVPNRFGVLYKGICIQLNNIQSSKN